jgi:hypothetical protein
LFVLGCLTASAVDGHGCRSCCLDFFSSFHFLHSRRSGALFPSSWRQASRDSHCNEIFFHSSCRCSRFLNWRWRRSVFFLHRDLPQEFYWNTASRYLLNEFLKYSTSNRNSVHNFRSNVDRLYCQNLTWLSASK